VNSPARTRWGALPDGSSWTELLYTKLQPNSID
jgi:hypothetical protein